MPTLLDVIFTTFHHTSSLAFLFYHRRFSLLTFSFLCAIYLRLSHKLIWLIVTKLSRMFNGDPDL